jgi:site-specific recombinase XerD
MVQLQLKLSEAFDEMILTMTAARRSVKTVEDYQNCYRKFGKFIGLSTLIANITINDIKRFLAHISTTPITPNGIAKRPTRLLSGKSIQNHYIALSALWTMLINDGYATEHIIRKVPKPTATKKEILPLTKEEVIALQNSCSINRSWSTNSRVTSRRVSAWRDEAIIAVLIDCGVRNDELVNILLSDVDLKNHCILLRTTKGDKHRTVTFGNATRKKLLRWIKSRKDEVQWLFTTVNFPIAQMNNDPLTRMIANLAKKAGIARRVTPHLLRHTCLTMSHPLHPCFIDCHCPTVGTALFSNKGGPAPYFFLPL